MSHPPKLILVATPIGNLGDLSPRAVDALRESQIWCVEDSRVSAKLQAHLDLKRPMRVVNEHTTDSKLAEYLTQIEEMDIAALLTDGGCPVISDPGTRLVSLALERGFEVDAIPGPSAVTTALMLSGFYGQRFVFLGFLPRKPGPMAKILAEFAESTLSVIVFESLHRIDALLKAAHQALGERRYAICRELTKQHQQVVRGRLPYVPNEAEMPRKGEFTVVFEGLTHGNEV